MSEGKNSIHVSSVDGLTSQMVRDFNVPKWVNVKVSKGILSGSTYIVMSTRSSIEHKISVTETRSVKEETILESVVVRNQLKELQSEMIRRLAELTEILNEG